MPPGARDAVVFGLSALLALLVLAELAAAPHSHPVFPWHGLPGYSALIGLGGCYLVVLISKAIGRRWLQRPEPAEVVEDDA